MITVQPAHRLRPSRRRDRPWRIALPLLAGLVVLALLAGLSTMTAVSWAQQHRFPPAPAVHELGTPRSLELSSRFADVTVERSSEVDQVTLALVPAGSTDLPAAGATARATVDTRTTADRLVATVREPAASGPIPWQSESRDVLVLVPAAQDLRLAVTTEVADVAVDGSYSALSVRTDTGDVDLENIASDGAVSVTSDVGDVDLQMRSGNASPLRVRARTGDVSIAVPGQRQYDVTTHTSVGDVQIEPGLQAASGAEAPEISATTDVGDVTISR